MSGTFSEQIILLNTSNAYMTMFRYPAQSNYLSKEIRTQTNYTFDHFPIIHSINNMNAQDNKNLIVLVKYNLRRKTQHYLH
jgi:hypothetical protein